MITPPSFETGRPSEAEAPANVIESMKHASTYRAVVTRRHGIRAGDFFDLSQRFIALCTSAYGESDVELRLNQGVPVGLAQVAASFGEYAGAQGTPLSMDEIDADKFSDIFEIADSIVLRIDPRHRVPEFMSSFAQVSWTRQRPGVLSFSAQDGGSYHLPGNERPLQSLLTRKMFFVPDSAPKRGLKVKLGISEYIKARGPNKREAGLVAGAIAMSLSRR